MELQKVRYCISFPELSKRANILLKEIAKESDNILSIQYYTLEELLEEILAELEEKNDRISELEEAIDDIDDIVSNL